MRYVPAFSDCVSIRTRNNVHAELFTLVTVYFDILAEGELAGVESRWIDG